MLVIGLNAYHGDASAAAMVDGQLVAAAEEERFTRVKHAAGFPRQALRYVASAAGAGAGEPCVLAVARDPWARVLKKALYAVRMPAAAGGRARVHGRFGAIAEEAARALGWPAGRIRIQRVEHHTAHLASAFLMSPFDEAALLSIDGLGDFASAMWGVGRGNGIYPGGSVTFPHSLGIFYSALTQYLGFEQYGDEYKVMGLASYGEPEYADELERIVLPARNGEMEFALGLDYFVHHRSGVPMTWGEGAPVVGRLYSDHLIRRLGPARAAGAPIEARHQAIAASMQRRLEDVVLDRLRVLRQRTGLRRLCLAGGVAFNCVANGKIRERTGFEEVYVQSAAGDAGLAIGAAAYVWHDRLGHGRDFVMDHSYWGPSFRDDQLRRALDAHRGEIERAGAAVREMRGEEELCRWTAERLADGKIVGWFQGRMEWGPRALGNRSILADPRRAEIRDVLNAKIKRREMFRPFAPSILEEAAAEYFEPGDPSPFMLMAYRVRADKRGVIPATTHVDGTGRVQTIHPRQNPLYHRLIEEFRRRTGVPVLLNTSFNENEPVVNAPEEAIACFLRTKMDVLVLGSYVVERSGGSEPPGSSETR